MILFLLTDIHFQIIVSFVYRLFTPSHSNFMFMFCLYYFGKFSLQVKCEQFAVNVLKPQCV